MQISLAYISGMKDRHDPFITALPSGVCYLHACLREAGHGSVLANLSAWSEAEIAQYFKVNQPGLVAISQWTHNRHASLRLAEIVRSAAPAAVIVMGGGHATFQYGDLLFAGSPVNLVVIGEGEATLLELAIAVAESRPWQLIDGIATLQSGKVIVNPSRAALQNLDQLPFSSAYLQDSIGLDCEQQAEFILTARGCPSACTFCSSPAFWNRRVRFRSPANIVDEIISIRNRFGLIYFSLRDDTFTADRGRTIEFCRLLIERKVYIVWNCQSRVTALDEELLLWMKRAGCECVQLGVESGSPRILDLLGKRITPQQVEEAAGAIRKAGINLSVYLIGDIPAETERDLDATIALMGRIRPDDGYVSPLAYFPGTELYKQALRDGLVAGDLFRKSKAEALFAVSNSGKNSRRLLKALDRCRPDHPGDYDQQKRRLGYCYTTNIMAGEYYRQIGMDREAAKEFLQITESESDNPWGWFLLAELSAGQGNQRQALQYYRRVLEIVPAHSPSLAAVAKAGAAAPRRKRIKK